MEVFENLSHIIFLFSPFSFVAVYTLQYHFIIQGHEHLYILLCIILYVNLVFAVRNGLL